MSNSVLRSAFRSACAFCVTALLATYSAAAVETPTVEEHPAEQKPEPREGKSVWLERKIAKPTRWLENLVKPMNIWLEGKIQAPVDSRENDTTRLPPGNISAPGAISPSSKTPQISADEAADAARKLVAGNVLKVKLIAIPESHLIASEGDTARFAYRVRLISKRGEIHILYIDALSKELLEPVAQPAPDKYVQEQSKEQSDE